MTTPDAISAKMLATLAQTIPGLSCEVGTPERKIVDAVAEAISEAYVAQYLLGSLMDIDTKAGLELEQFVGIWGFGRRQGKPARGVVRVQSTVAQSSDTTFQLGTQFYTVPGLAGLSATLYYSSTQAVVLTAGSFTCDVPVQCAVVGTQGNVPPDSIAYLGNAIGGSTVTNLTAMVGGTDTETDAELRQRFKDTMMRNVAGTADFYEAICQQNNSVSRVVSFGPLSLYKTQIAVPSTDLVLSVNQDVKYAWDQMESVFTDLGQENEVFYSPINDYSFEGGTSPTLTRNPSGSMVVDDIVDIEFQYTTRSSRNDPIAGIVNKVDIFVDGVNPYTVKEKTVVVAAALSSSSANALYTGNFVRVGETSSPTATNRFMRLGSVPLVAFPSTLTVSGVVYTQGTHYHVLVPNHATLNATTLLAGSQLEVAGIEWESTGAATDAELTISYVYNRVPELLNAIISSAKQIATDVLVHQGRFTYLQPCVSIEYDRSYSVATINSSIVNRLQIFFASLPFGAQVKLSQVAMYIQQTLGVVDCKITTSDEDSVHYGVQLFTNSSDPTPAVSETTDFKLDDNQLAVYQGVQIRRVATP